MRKLPVVLAAVLSLLCTDVALAITSNCPSLQNQQNKQMPAVNPMNQATYMCNNAASATDPPKLGDLSAQGEMMNAQVCDSNCVYRPLFPEDPDSPMIPQKCYSEHDMQRPGGQPGQPYAINGNPSSMAANQAPPPPYQGTGGNCEALMIPQAPINIENQPPPTVKQTKQKQATPPPSPSPSPAPSPH